MKILFGADAAHWMAILGMEQYAFYLWNKSSAATVDTITDIPRVCQSLSIRALEN